MSLIPIFGFEPQVHPDCWVAPNATVTGQVVIGSRSSVWFQAVIRGDVNKIIIGSEVNIQDGAIVHGSKGRADTIIKDKVTIGHRAIIHGCRIESQVLIGMGAVILDDAVVPSHCIVAAGAVVRERAKLESGFIYAGVPAVKVKAVPIEKLALIMKESVEGYVQLSQKYASITS